MKKGKILALDFGEKHVGVAVSDEKGMLAFGRGVIRNFGSLQELFRRIKVLCDEEGVESVLMGIPVGKKGESTKQTRRILEIGKKLNEYLKITVEYSDESFSTFEAEQKLKELNVKPRDRKKIEDELAATIILQKYLDKL